MDSPINADFNAEDDFEAIFFDITTNKKIDICYYWKNSSDESHVNLLMGFNCSGVYHALVSYKGSLLKNGDFNIVCLTEDEYSMVGKSVRSNNCNFTARLLTDYHSNNIDNNKQPTKPRNVYCSISPKQLTIKEYYLKIIPKRIATFRLLPSTKFYFTKHYKKHLSTNVSPIKNNFDSNSTSTSTSSLSSLEQESAVQPDEFIVIDDGSQTPVELAMPKRNILVAIFTYFLLNRIGGSETFGDKREFFYSEVRRYHHKNNYIPGRIHLKIYRDSLLESSIRALKSNTDWCKKIEIEFVGENGIDRGGLLREWCTILCKKMFEPQLSDMLNEEIPMFMRFKNDNQGLIHPNSLCTKLSYFEFAGRLVGKSLLDASLGSNFKCLINARFSRSFLAQWIGLRINYRYFEYDDPDLYTSKIKFILENDVSSFSLYFADEEYDKTGKLIRTYDLIPNGSNIPVTEENKIHYLDSLAQYRLATKVKDQVESFLKGLYYLIPDNLLSIFNENEIELLVCGASTYSLSDLRMNHVVSGAVYDFQKVVDWFWRSLTNFNDVEFARLLQFTTGCSHLPPGGFSELVPRFQINSSMSFGTLPTAHTCFNQICLPDYDSFEEFDRALRIAITEGSEGFGLA